MLVFLFQGLLALSANAAVAEPTSLHGYITHHGEQVYLDIDAQHSYAIYPANSDVAQDLRELEDGDYIEGTGTAGTITAVINAIEFIGLKRILGKWVDKTQHVFMDFQSFSQAKVWTKETNVKTLDYALSPDQKNRYTIFLGDKQAVVIGTLSHYDSKIRIDLINTQTGLIEKTLRLSAIRN